MSAMELTRRLSAILSADVEGYSRLMREDEEATVRTITRYRTAVTHLIQQYRGRVVDSPGDNVLAEFSSVVDGVNCAVEIQRELAERNAELPENRRMRFRIGINLGDVLQEGDRIYGDGVNIAARMETLAEAGGICISGTVYDAVESKIGLEYEFRGEHEVKNIDKPIRAYRVLSYPGAAAHRVVKAKRAVGKTWRNTMIVIAAVVVSGAAVGVWHSYFRAPPREPASVEKMALPLPEKPSIAVLPFADMSEEPKQEFFSDGLTEEIITALSKAPQLFVIASNTSFTYKGKPVKIKEVSEELGVQYVLEGSIRRAGERVRITAQLIDALRGHHLWSERYDREIKDLFAVQDDITKNIITAVHVKLTDGERARVLSKGTFNLNAYLKTVEAQWYVNQSTKESVSRAQQLAEEAIALDPNYAYAHMSLGITHVYSIWLGMSHSPRDSLKRAIELYQKAVALDEASGEAHALLSYALVMARQYDSAAAECEKGMTLEPNSYKVLYVCASTQTFVGRRQEAITLFREALRVNPKPPASCYRHFAIALRDSGQYNEAIELSKKALEQEPNDSLAYLVLASACEMAGRKEEARAAAKEILRIIPTFSLERLARTTPHKDRAVAERFIDALRKAGLPDKPPLPLSDKPSIAVLPFENMSEDKSQEFLADGLSEEIINAMTRLPNVFVIARSSSFTYEGKSIDVRQIGRELGVRYVLEGSVRRDGARMRITAQLVDTDSGNHLFSERYDREMNALFELQDDITMKVMTAMRVQLADGDYARAFAKGTKNLAAYLKVMESYQSRQLLTREGQARARQLAEEAIALDPEYAMAYCHLAAALGNEVAMGVYKNVAEILARSMALAQRAVALDDSLAQAHITLGFQYTMRGDFDRAVAEGERAVALEPNSAEIVAGLAGMLEWADRPQDAIPLFQKALRLSPVPQLAWLLNMASAYIRMGEHEETISICKNIVHKSPDQLLAQVFLAVAYMSAGREQEARDAVSEIVRIRPQFSYERDMKRMPRKNQAENERRLELLRKAGLPG